MPRLGFSFLLSVLLLIGSAPQNIKRAPDLPTSDLIDYARLIARDSGYDVADTRVYGFSINTPHDSLVPGYTTIQFIEHEHVIKVIMVNNRTGQAIEFNLCEIFDYPNLKPWQELFIGRSNAVLKTPQELADDVDCRGPKVLTDPLPLRKRQQ